jgi:hypothetical protein
MTVPVHVAECTCTPGQRCHWEGTECNEAGCYVTGGGCRMHLDTSNPSEWDFSDPSTLKMTARCWLPGQEDCLPNSWARPRCTASLECTP